MLVHHEISVKVNALVDEGVAELVEAMSQIDGLVTVESCQGDPGKRDAYVIFRFGDWKKSGELLFDKLLPALSPDLRASVSFGLSAYDSETTLGKISVEPATISELSAAIRACVLVTGNTHSKAVTQNVRTAGSNGVDMVGMPSVK